MVLDLIVTEEIVTVESQFARLPVGAFAVVKIFINTKLECYRVEPT